MTNLVLVLIALLAASCSRYLMVDAPPRLSGTGGNAFVKSIYSANWEQRDSAVVAEIFSGNIPSFLLKFQPVHTSIFDSATAQTIHAVLFVSPDYLSVGNDADWVRMPVTPGAAQKIADSFHCFLPTRKLVNDIYRHASVKLEPIPLFAFRDSTPTMHHHHLMVEGQRRQQPGLIAGIKKDLVISSRVAKDQRPNRVAIYGWHRLDGVPIQPLYTGHVSWYVDYSHGVRLVYEKLKVNGRWMHYTDVLLHPLLRKLICDEPDCSFVRYPY